MNYVRCYYCLSFPFVLPDSLPSRHKNLVFLTTAKFVPWSSLLRPACVYTPLRTYCFLYLLESWRTGISNNFVTAPHHVSKGKMFSFKNKNQITQKQTSSPRPWEFQEFLKFIPCCIPLLQGELVIDNILLRHLCLFEPSTLVSLALLLHLLREPLANPWLYSVLLTVISLSLSLVNLCLFT